jgi:hypothetical protein
MYLVVKDLLDGYAVPQCLAIKGDSSIALQSSILAISAILTISSRPSPSPFIPGK